MSITRLQQARQMYATGQRVAKTMDGSRPGYRGSDWGDQAASRGAYSGSTGSNTPSPGDTGGQGGGSQNNTGSASNEDRSSALQTYNTKKATGRLGRQDANQMDSTVFYGTPTKTNPSGMIDIGYQGPLNPREQLTYDLLNTPYKPINLPFYIPGSTLINTAGNFLGNLGYKKNTQFFADNVAGKYGYGYGIDAYKEYMKNRMAGKVNAYGRPLTEGELRLRDGDGDRGQGIMDVVTEATID